MLTIDKPFCCFFLIVTVAFMVSRAEDPDGGMFTSTNKADCVNKMVEWCGGMQYPKDGAGVSMLSIALSDESGNFWRYFCASDSDGTNCTRNGSPWFSCSADHVMNYKGVELKKNAVDGVDDEICNTTQRAFNDLFIQNLFPNPTNLTVELSKSMESFFRMLSDLQGQLDILRDSIFNDCFPFCPPEDPSVPPKGPSVPPRDPEAVATELPVPNSNDSNQLERE